MYKPFTYVLSSKDRLNTEEFPTSYNLEFGGFLDAHDRYNVEVVQMLFSHNIDTVTTHGIIYAQIQNLNTDNSIFPSINGNKFPLIPISIYGINQYISPFHGALSWEVSGMKSKRIITIDILDFELDKINQGITLYNYYVDEDGIQSNEDAYFTLTLRMTPIG